MSGIDIDLTPLWASVNDNLPLFITIFAIPFGISFGATLLDFITTRMNAALKRGK